MADGARIRGAKAQSLINPLGATPQARALLFNQNFDNGEPTDDSPGANCAGLPQLTITARCKGTSSTYDLEVFWFSEAAGFYVKDTTVGTQTVESSAPSQLVLDVGAASRVYVRATEPTSDGYADVWVEALP